MPTRDHVRLVLTAALLLTVTYRRTTRSLSAHLGGDPPAFVTDYDGVISALEDALAKKGR